MFGSQLHGLLDSLSVFTYLNLSGATLVCSDVEGNCRIVQILPVHPCSVVRVDVQCRLWTCSVLLTEVPQDLGCSSSQGNCRIEQFRCGHSLAKDQGDRWPNFDSDCKVLPAEFREASPAFIVKR